MFKNKIVSAWKKVGAKCIVIAAVMAPIVGITAAYADADYSKSAISNAISTAFVDAQQAVDVGSYTKGSGDKKEETKGSATETKGGGDAKGSGDEIATQADLNARAAQIVNAGNFGNFGLVYGTSDQSSRAILSTINNPTSVSNREIEQYDALTNNAATQYHTFGLAMTRLMSQAKKMKVEAISNTAAMDAWNQSVMKMSNFGMRLLKKWNPAPVVLSFVDDSELNAAANADNGFIERIRDDENLSGIVHMIGGPVNVGSVTVSRSFLIMVSINILILAYGLIGRLANGRLFDDSVRRVIVTLVASTAGIVLGARMLNMGVNWFADISDKSSQAKNSHIIEKHLNLSDWYATSFSLPSNVNLRVENGAFKFTREDVKAINQHTYEIVTGHSGTDEEIAERIISASQTDNNETSINFNTPIRKNGQSWATNKVFEVAEAVASKPKEDISADSLSAGYIDVGKDGLRGSGNSKAASYSMAGNSNYGMSPIAAYQMMRTSFDKNGWAVKSNTATLKIPSVAISVAGSASNAQEAPPLVKFVASIAMVIASVKAFISIISSGFGGVFKGGITSSIGSAAGSGELVGGVVALIVGLFGIGMIMGLSMSMLDGVYAIINDLLNTNQSGGGLVESALEPLLSGLRTQSILGINWGDMIADMFVTAVNAVVSLIALFTLPKISKIPIEGWGHYMSGLPSAFAQRAQGMANDFINGHHLAGNGPLSQIGASRGFGGGGAGAPTGISGSVADAASGVKDSAKSVGSAASVLGAYALGKMMSVNEGDNNTENMGDENGFNQTADTSVDAQESTVVEGGQESVANTEEKDVEEQGDNVAHASNIESMEEQSIAQNSSETKDIQGPKAEVNKNSSVESSAETSTADNSSVQGDSNLAVNGNESIAQTSIDKSAPDNINSEHKASANSSNSANNGTMNNVSSNDSISQQSHQESSDSGQNNISQQSNQSANANTQNVTGNSSVANQQNSIGGNSNQVNASDSQVDGRSSMTSNMSSKTSVGGETNPTQNNNSSNKTTVSSGSRQSRGGRLLNNARGRMSGVAGKVGQAAKAGARAASAGVSGHDAARAGMQLGATLIKGAAGVSHKDTLRQNHNQNAQNQNRRADRQQNIQASRGANTTQADRSTISRQTATTRREQVQNKQASVVKAQAERSEAIRTQVAEKSRQRGEIARGERNPNDFRGGKPQKPINPYRGRTEIDE